MPFKSYSHKTLPEKYKPLEGDYYMAKFVNEVMERESFQAYCMYCKPDELYRHIETLTNENIRVMVASMIKQDNLWNTTGMQSLDETLMFSPNDNLQESNSPMCVAAALDSLGFNVPIDQRVKYGIEFSQTPSMSYEGHVMAVKKDEYWTLSDQYGVLKFSDPTKFSGILESMAKFRLTQDSNAQQGYCFK